MKRNATVYNNNNEMKRNAIDQRRPGAPPAAGRRQENGARASQGHRAPAGIYILIYTHIFIYIIYIHTHR